MREMASRKEYSYNHLRKYMIGATYLPLQDCLKLQGFLNESNLVPIIREQDEVITVKKNWSSYLYYVQKYESEGFGAQFYMVDKYISTGCDTRLIWILSNILTKIPEIYNIVETKVKFYNDWKPWMLAHLTKKCLHPISRRGSSKNPFKTTYITNTKKIAEKIGINEEYIFDIHEDMSRLFSDIDSIQVISINNYQGEFQNIDACGIFIMTSDTYENHQRNENSFNVNQNQILRIRRDKYELRFVSLMKVNRNNKYEEAIFARHGFF